jgi:hypothetical protein
MNRAIFVLTVVIFSNSLYAQNPSLKDTLDWMHSAFSDNQSKTAFLAGHTRELNYVIGKDGTPSCAITIVDHWTNNEGKPTSRYTEIDLSLIDPGSILFYRDTVEKEKGVGEMTFAATNDKKVIIEKTTINNKPYGLFFETNKEWIGFIGPEYAERFAKALKHAVELCDGKPSTF